jgi:CheY-like chemotaxis protein
VDNTAGDEVSFGLHFHASLSRFTTASGIQVAARILIIEDNPASMELMAYLLGAFGHTALMAFDGDSGVRIAREQRPDLILCDAHLPRLDGYGVVRVLKADPVLCKIPVLVVTALAMVGDRERLIEAGFDGYIGKPIEPEQFVAELAPFLPRGDRVSAKLV